MRQPVTSASCQSLFRILVSRVTPSASRLPPSVDARPPLGAPESSGILPALRAALVPVFLGLAGVLTALTAAPAAAQQTGTLLGSVVDEESGEPVSSVSVEVLGADEDQAGGVLTNTQGRFRILLPPGRYSLVVSSLGYETERVSDVEIVAGESRNVSVELATFALVLNPLIVTASRREEKALDAPASVSVVSAERIRGEVAATPVEHVEGMKGVDIARNGLQQSNVVVRGFNNVFSGSLLVLTDNRYAHVPSLRTNAYHMIPVTSRDVERVEVVLGPGAALYGPNSAGGVMHIITSSPIDDPGSSASVASGYRSANALESSGGGVYQGTFRQADRINDGLGIKVSGQWFQGDDWAYVDPFEEVQSDLNPGNPRIANRLDDASRWGGEARVDWRPWDDGEVIFNGGLTRVMESVDLTGIGASQVKDWTYSYLQTRLRKGRLFAQAFVNMSDAGDTYLLRTGNPTVDNSRMWVGQVQHGFDWSERQSFTYGLDLQRTVPRTGGTITGSNEEDDVIDEVGGYLHSETSLTDRLDLVAALRLDWHSRLPDVNVSPRAALAYRPAEGQNFRVTFNRAFSTPNTNNLFLDIVAGQLGIPPSSPLFSYDIRARGVPESGFTFQEECAGGVQDLCMYTPLAPGPRFPAAAHLTPFWNGLIESLAPESLQPFLTDPGQAGDPALASTLLGMDFREAQKPRCDPGTSPEEVDCLDPARLFVPRGAPEGVPRLTSTITNTYEVGYKGLLAGRFLVSADVYRNDIEDFVGPLRIETPNVFLSPQETVAFIRHRLQPLVDGGSMSGAEADATAQQLGGSLAQVPVGTVAPDGAGSSDLVVTYKNFGDMTLYGVDLGLEVLASDRLSFSGNLSWVSEECMDFDGDGSCTGGQDISLNAPSLKGALGVRFESFTGGWSAGSRVRMTDGFVMNSGAYVGEVDGYTIVDVDATYDLPWVAGASTTLSVNNVFNELHREFVGGPHMGRLALLRLSYDF